MKWNKKKHEGFSASYSVTGRKNNYKLKVVYNDLNRMYYFLAEKDDTTFNSLWEHPFYNNEEECKIACEKWVDFQTQNKRDIIYRQQIAHPLDVVDVEATSAL